MRLLLIILLSWVAAARPAGASVDRSASDIPHIVEAVRLALVGDGSLPVVWSNPLTGHWGLVSRNADLSDDCVGYQRIAVVARGSYSFAGRGCRDADMWRLLGDRETGFSPVARDRRVMALQILLYAAGYDPGPIDGLGGPQTRRAFFAFQRNSGTPPQVPPTLQSIHDLWGHVVQARLGEFSEFARQALADAEAAAAMPAFTSLIREFDRAAAAID